MISLSIPAKCPHPRRLVVLAMAAALATTAEAQGPAEPTEPKLVAAYVPAAEGAKLLAANVARLMAAGAPGAIASGLAEPFAAWSVSAPAFRDSILLSVARTTLGTPYKRGGHSFGRSFDCSGLVRHVMTALSVALPRTAAKQAGEGLEIGRDTALMRPGDLLTFGTGIRSISHVGIYVGNGRFVHASRAAGQVIETDLHRRGSSLVKSWRGVRRVLPYAGADSSGKGDG